MDNKRITQEQSGGHEYVYLYMRELEALGAELKDNDQISEDYRIGIDELIDAFRTYVVEGK